MCEAFHRANLLPFAAHRRACRIPGIGTDVGPVWLSSSISSTKDFLHSVQRRHHMITTLISLRFGPVS
jgi:hypothetical protein